MQRVDILHFLSLSCWYICKMSLSLRSGHLMCTNKSLVPKHYKLYSYLIIKPMDCCYRCYQWPFGHISLYCAYNAKYRATNRIDSFTFVQGNTINEMVQTNSHRLNTHVQRLSLSVSVVIIIITGPLATSRIIPQYFNHLLL